MRNKDNKSAGSNEEYCCDKPEEEKTTETEPHTEQRESETDRAKGQLSEVERIKREYEEKLKVVNEKMLRIAADFDNYKKRVEKEYEFQRQRAKVEVIKTILPVVDNLSRATQHLGNTTEVESVMEGIKMVEKNFSDVLKRMGVKKVESIGQPFDPTIHEAIAQEETEEVPPGIVYKEVHPAYLLDDNLLRPALVVVSKPPGKKKKTDFHPEEHKEENERDKEPETAKPDTN